MKELLTPCTEGFIFPAEWEKHLCTWLTFPKPNESWTSNFTEACNEYIEFVKMISLGEEVNIITDNELHSSQIAETILKKGGQIHNIHFHTFGSNDCWCRDHGPSFLVNRKTNERALVKWEFNAWGSKYESDADNQIGNRISDFYGYKTFRPGIVMEGGSIEVNGKGSLMTTRACLLNKNRNASQKQSDIEEYLMQYYTVKNIIWLNNGVEGDDTDGHIDDIARFVNDDTILIASEVDRSQPNSQVMSENYEILKKSRLENGKQPVIVEIPMPEPLFNGKDALPASYANFYICNQAVIVPVFGCKNDDRALQIIQQCFPNHKVEGLYAGNIIYGLGSWHCLSQQQIL